MATPIVSVTMDQPTTQPIQLGQAGENNATIIQWADVLPQWQEDYGEGTVQLINQRSGESTAYPVAITVDGTTINWLVTSTDSAIPGAGLCDLQYVVNDVLAKSILYRTIVSRSISSGTAPSPGSDWITEGMQQITQAQADAVEAVEQAGQAQIDAIQALDVYTKTESDARYAPIASALTVSGTGDNSATLSPTIPWYMQGLTLYGKTTQDGAPSQENPVPLVSPGNGGQIGVDFVAANLLPLQMSTTTANGFTVNVSQDQAIDVQESTATSSNSNSIVKNLVLYPGTYTLSAWCTSSTNASVTVLKLPDYSIVKVMQISDYAYTTFTLDEESSLAVGIKGASGETIALAGGKIMISAGTDTPEWLPYQAQPFIIQTPNGLPGIPVTTGGNYTDSTGQQYISNILDFSIGLETIALAQIDSYNGEEIPGAYMSTTGSLTTGATVLYALSTPTTQPIDAETMAAYQALQSYSGTTNIICQGVGIQATALANANQLISTLTQRITALETAGGTTA